MLLNAKLYTKKGTTNCSIENVQKSIYQQKNVQTEYPERKIYMSCHIILTFVILVYGLLLSEHLANFIMCPELVS